MILKICFKIILLPVILLSCLALLSCRSDSALLLHPAAPELNRRAPDVFDVSLETSKGKITVVDEQRRETFSNTGSRIQFGGAPVDLIISEVSEPTTLRIYPGAGGEFTLYDDDGESLGYRDGSDPKTIWIRFRWNDEARRLVMEADPRMKKWPGGKRGFTIEVVGGAHPKAVEFHGQRQTVVFY